MIAEKPFREPRFHLGQSVSVLWYLDDQPIREVGEVIGLVYDCPHLGSGWVYSITRPDDPEFPQAWFDESDLTPLLPSPLGLTRAGDRHLELEGMTPLGGLGSLSPYTLPLMFLLWYWVYRSGYGHATAVPLRSGAFSVGDYVYKVIPHDGVKFHVMKTFIGRVIQAGLNGDYLVHWRSMKAWIPGNKLVNARAFIHILKTSPEAQHKTQGEVTTA